MQAQLARMAELSRQKAENTRIEASKIALVAFNEKKEAWNKVKVELPDEAEFLTNMGAVFGRLASVEVTNLETGEVFKIR